MKLSKTLAFAALGLTLASPAIAADRAVCLEYPDIPAYMTGLNALQATYSVNPFKACPNWSQPLHAACDLPYVDGCYEIFCQVPDKSTLETNCGVAPASDE
jgi:hypothetical protein